MADGRTRGEYSVAEFFADGSCQYARRFVGPRDAVAAFILHTTNVAARVGLVRRVIITDGGDCTNMEWKFGEGVTYPPQARTGGPLDAAEEGR